MSGLTWRSLARDTTRIASVVAKTQQQRLTGSIRGTSLLRCASINATSGKRTFVLDALSGLGHTDRERDSSDRTAEKGRDEEERWKGLWNLDPVPSEDTTADNDAVESQYNPYATQQIPHEEQESRYDFGRRREKRYALLDIDYNTQLDNAVGSEDWDLVVRCLFAAQKQQDFGFIASIKDEEFTTILKLVRPQILLGELLGLHKQASRAIERGFNHVNIMGLHDIVDEYNALLRSIVNLREDSGCRITLEQYTVLLQNTKALRLKPLAEQLWAKMITAEISPNIECYNGYIGSIISEDPVPDVARQWERSNRPFGRLRRQAQFSRNEYARANRSQKPGRAFDTVTQVITHMLSTGIGLNVETYALYIRAASIQGSMSRIVAVMQKVWGLSIKEIIASGNTTPKAIPPNHPCYPTPQLIHEVVRAFCSNNDIRGATKLLCYMAYNYRFVVEERTWALLFEWAHDLSKRQSARERLVYEKAPVERAAVFTIWQTATSPPFNLKPSFAFFDIMMRSLYCHGSVLPALDLMETYRERYEAEAKQEQKKAWSLVVRTAKQSERASSDGRLRFNLNQAIRKWQLASLRVLRDRAFLQRWLFYFLHTTSDSARRASVDIHTILIPRMLYDWQKFANRVVEYSIPTGVVRLETYTDEDYNARQKASRRRIDSQKRILDKAPSYVDYAWIYNQDMDATTVEDVYTDVRSLDPDREFLDDSML